VPPLQNDLAAYQFDSAVLFFGLTIKHARQEQEEYGPPSARQSRNKYTLEQLLDPDFRLPPKAEHYGGIKAMAAANPDIVGRWKQAPKKV
jgi:hypothetical protein